MEAKKQIKTKTAKAMFDLYKSMPDNVQKEVKELILLAEESKSSGNNDLAIIANQSFGDIWNTPENDHWDNFLKAHS